MGFWGLISGNTHDRDAFPMATIQSPMQRCNAVLRAFGARYRLREHRRSPWITVYQLGKGGTTREHTVKGYAAADPEAIESLQDLLIEATRSGKPAVLPDRQQDLVSSDSNDPAGPRSAPPWWRSNGARG